MVCIQAKDFLDGVFTSLLLQQGPKPEERNMQPK